MNRQVGYCTNVHAGAGLGQARANLERYACAVKRLASPDRPMGAGLWLSAAAARQLLEERGVVEFAAWLADQGLVPFTLNGFPYGDFHQQVVKHEVYRPTWAQPERYQYTCDLIAILGNLLPVGLEGSISTLPIAWGNPSPGAAELAQAAENLGQVAELLAHREDQQGRLIYLCLEPEPGCVLQRSGDVVRFFEDYLLPGRDEGIVRRYLRVCHDVCHQAVMFEEQAEVLRRYRAAGVRVGKVQVSSAVCLPLGRTPPDQHAAALAQLGGFAEDRYLHQTVVRQDGDGLTVFYQDLPEALRAGETAGEWRVHFHIPVYLERFGLLETTRPAILECLRATAEYSDVTHFEVETYAWGVLPPELRQPDLAAGIAHELAWFADVCQ